MLNETELGSELARLNMSDTLQPLFSFLDADHSGLIDLPELQARVFEATRVDCTGGDSTSELCAPGSYGRFCARCESGHYRTSYDSKWTCKVCTYATGTIVGTGLLYLSFFGMSCLLVVIYYAFGLQGSKLSWKLALGKKLPAFKRRLTFKASARKGG